MSEPHTCAECSRVFQWGKDDDSHFGIAAAGETCGENAYWKLTGHMAAEHPEAGFQCARRGESPMQHDGNDWWGSRDGHKSCSYCGSMNPDELFAAIEAGAELGPTDKSYKVYVDLPHPDAGKPGIFSSASHETPGYIKLTTELCDERGLGSYERTHYVGQWVKITPRGPKAHAKFYFQHFSFEQQQRFIDLLNAKKINIGVPGYFYSRPFFIAAPLKQAAE